MLGRYGQEPMSYFFVSGPDELDNYIWENPQQDKQFFYMLLVNGNLCEQKRQTYQKVSSDHH